MTYPSVNMRRTETPRCVRAGRALGCASVEAAPRRPVPTWQVLQACWRDSPESARYRDVLRTKTKLVPAVVGGLRPSLGAIVDALPGYYVGKIRPAAPYLFREWMPIGYSCMLASDELETLWQATLAVMGYGAAVTVLDDVADTDAFDRILGEGSSDIIAQAALAHMFPELADRPGRVPAELMRVIDFVRVHTDHFIEYLSELPGYHALEGDFRGLLRSFFEGVVLCRRVRGLMAAGQAEAADFTEFATTIPHGMTVALIGLLGFAHNGVDTLIPAEDFLRDAHLAQAACHYQNAIATLDRELREGDASNPIIIDAIEQGLIDQRDFVHKRIPAVTLRARLGDSRARIVDRLARMMTQLDSRRSHYERHGAGAFFETFSFGIRNLSFLYDLAWGRV